MYGISTQKRTSNKKNPKLALKKIISSYSLLLFVFASRSPFFNKNGRNME